MSSVSAVRLFATLLLATYCSLALVPHAAYAEIETVDFVRPLSPHQVIRTGTLVQVKGQLQLRTSGGDLPLSHPEHSNPQIAVRDIFAFKNTGQTVSIKGEYYEIDGERVLTVDEFAPGNHTEFIAGRVTADGQGLETHGGVHPLASSLSQLLRAGFEGDFAGAGLIVAGTEMWMLLSPRPDAMITSSKSDNAIAKETKMQVHATADANGHRIIGFQTPGTDSDQNWTNDKRGVLEVPKNMKIGKRYRRAFLEVGEIKSPLPLKNPTRDKLRMIRAKGGYHPIPSPSAALRDLNVAGQLRSTVRRVAP